MAAPHIPPRPTRAQNQTLAPSTASMDIPKVPPRPTKRSVERSVSPHRDTFARSPLNDLSFAPNGQMKRRSVDLPQRPPSVTLPSIGQEGNEYASLDSFAADESSPKQTMAVAGDLPLYAPTASLPTSSAKARVATVTRTDSSQAQAAGIPKLHGAYSDIDDKGTSSSIKSASSRPSSVYKDDEEHGIPEIGLQVPMYPNAGDVQAPTPSPYNQSKPTGIGFFNDGSAPAPRHHSRTKSGREIFTGPPGSYGMHGHGTKPRNEFERAWYEKHPEDAAREARGEYGPAIQDNRKEWALSSDDLNKLVRDSAQRGIGMGTSHDVIGTPDEQIGYMASEEYTSRMTSPRPSSIHQPSITTKKGRSSTGSSQTHVESPLRKMSFPVNQLDNKLAGVAGGSSDNAIEDENDDVIHVDPPSQHASRVGGAGIDPPTEDLGPHGGNTEEEGGFISERGPGMPILASDEVAKHPEAEWMQPAVSPELERRGSGDYIINEGGTPEYISGRSVRSRPSSRNQKGNTPPNGLQRFTSHEDERRSTPLDDVQEYEPLFPDDEEPKKKPTTATNKLKRPDLARHHFPSQDVWEDTPSSLQLQTYVETPEEEKKTIESPTAAKASQAFEKPEVEEERKNNITKEDQESFLSEHTKKLSNKHIRPDLLEETGRPSLQQRFPSQDIWEDAPDHVQLVTTVESPQMEEIASPEDAEPTSATKPQIPARPMVPARPQRTSEAKEASPVDRKPPTIPDRPKPQVPARPSKLSSKGSSEEVPLSKTLSAGSTGSAGSADSGATAKPKPAVPSRPAGGSKIAALKAGFMNDLNSRLQLGPQAPKVKEPEKEPEPEVEKAPLTDARKGRARGPARRKPAASPSATAEEPAKAAAPILSFSTWTVVHVSDEGIHHPTSTTVAKEEPSETVASPEEPIQHKHIGSEDREIIPGTFPRLAEGSAEETAPVEPLAESTETNTSASTTELTPTSSQDATVQTGQFDITVQDGEKTEKMTAYIGGNPQVESTGNEGNVLVKEGEREKVDADKDEATETTA